MQTFSAAKNRGHVHFFGVWADPKAALEEYTRQAADLHAGRTPTPTREGGTLLQKTANQYLTRRRENAARGLITAALFMDCICAVKPIVQFFGPARDWTDSAPADFNNYRLRLHDRVGVCAIDRMITVIRSMFKFAYESQIIDKHVKYGSQFNKLTSKERRMARNKHES